MYEEYVVRVYENFIEWRNKKEELHRKDGPAVECNDGYKAWWLNGNRHREDGPAREWSNGDREWYLNGVRHREDGPAVEWESGYRGWYLNGEELTEEKFNKRAKKCEEKIITINGEDFKLVKVEK